MTANVRILVAQVGVLRQQHRAGITPPFGALDDLFDTARLAEQDLAALDAGLMPPATPRQVVAAPRVTAEVFEAVGDVRLPSADVARFARALLTALDRSMVGAQGA